MDNYNEEVVFNNFMVTLNLFKKMSNYNLVQDCKNRGWSKLFTLKVLKFVRELDLKEAKRITDQYWNGYAAGDKFEVENKEYTLVSLKNSYALIGENNYSISEPKVSLGEIDNNFISLLCNYKAWKKI